MAKVKNKRNSGLADKVHSKKKGEILKKKLNPFEVHINREKLKVLGKKSKHDRGLPGVSRAKAIQKRKETLGTEMRLMNKTNTFIDKRIGEKDSQLSAEERMIARFAAERVRQRKGSVYNLADDELLTHRGQTLEQIEKFDDPRSDDEGDDEKAFGGLDNDFVSEGHFGGGMLSKSEKDGAKSHKDLIEQLIAESKKRKAEKQKEKEQTLDLTEKLDSEWKDLQPVVFKKMRVEEPPPPASTKEPESIIDKLLKQQEKRGDDYDKMMRELKFEKRGTPSDGLKSDEKQAKEERLRLEQLEKEREQRMLGEHEVTTRKVVQTAKHRSADDLDDNFELEDEKEFMLAYDKDGNPLVPEHILKDYSVPNAKPKFQDGVSDTSSDENDEENCDSSDEDEENDEIQSEIKQIKVNKTSDEVNDSETSHESDEEIDIKQIKGKQRKEKQDKVISKSNDDDEGSSEEQSDDDKIKQRKSNQKEKDKQNKEQSKLTVKLNDDVESSSEDSPDDDDDSNKIKQSKKTQNNNKINDNNKSLLNEDSDNKSKGSNETNHKDSGESSSESYEYDLLSKKITSTDSKKQKDVKINKVVHTEVDTKTVIKSDKLKAKKDKNAKEKINHEKPKSETVLFQNSANEENEDSSDEDETDEESGDENENSEANDESANDADFRTSDKDSDSENDQIEDSDKIESFFDLKNSEGDNLKELLADKSPYQQSVAIEKLIKSYDPSLGENNKDLLSRLFAHLLQYIHDIFTELKNEGDAMKAFLIFDKLAPFLYDLAHTNKVSSKKFLIELLKEKHDKYKKRPKRIPDLNTLIFFKLVSLIYPTSDFKHPVCSPALLFMSEILTTAKFNDSSSIAKGFFVTSLISEYTVLSKRFVPSAINFLRGILYLSANTSILNPIQVVPPFKLRKDAKLLNLELDCSKNKMAEYKMAAKDLVAEEIDDDFKIRCLLTTTVMLKEFFNNCNEFQAQECIFEPHIKLYGRIEMDFYPKKVAKTVKEVIQHMKSSLEVKTYTPLAKESKKPKLLRLYEPDIQEVFTGSKNSKLPREQAERKRLEGKIKKEMKGALREIRRDKAYIASVKIRQKIHSDNVRKDKVKQIYKDAAIQQGEINSLKRQK